MAFMNKANDCPFCGADAYAQHKRFCPEAPEPEPQSVLTLVLWLAACGAFGVLVAFIVLWLVFGAR